jgi:hypothetical protein
MAIFDLVIPKSYRSLHEHIKGIAATRLKSAAGLLCLKHRVGPPSLVRAAFSTHICRDFLSGDTPQQQEQRGCLLKAALAAVPAKTGFKGTKTGSPDD